LARSFVQTNKLFKDDQEDNNKTNCLLINSQPLASSLALLIAAVSLTLILVGLSIARQPNKSINHQSIQPATINRHTLATVWLRLLPHSNQQQQSSHVHSICFIQSQPSSCLPGLSTPSMPTIMQLSINNQTSSKPLAWLVNVMHGCLATMVL